MHTNTYSSLQTAGENKKTVQQWLRIDLKHLSTSDGEILPHGKTQKGPRLATIAALSSQNQLRL